MVTMHVTIGSLYGDHQFLYVGKLRNCSVKSKKH